MPTEQHGTSVAELYRELSTIEGETDEGEDHPSRRASAIVHDVCEELDLGESFRFEEGLVKNSLDELLLVLIELRDRETHGKALMEDLASLFDAQLSPGTVYPRLHALDDAGVLDVHELVRTKEYRITDPEAARERLESRSAQHLALGMLFYVAIEEL